MNSLDDICISSNKLEQSALLYGLINPFFETIDAQKHIRDIEKEAKREYPDQNLQFLYIFASLLQLNPQTKSLNKLYEHLPLEDKELRTIAVLHALTERGTLTLPEAAKKITILNNELNNSIKDKNLRYLTMIATLTEKGAEPIHLAKHLFCIQRIFKQENQR